ncbi:hypothetical protein BDV96DRAFT_642237 [Lophiotrema nucula]|uniref:Uncharacterized protein n=1 Tax=Lophiotrema nucula TaxID=690887 RepID=A0A6A5ZL74_9PLEO|nr:hypothetical protein BDV96DRAFT_642237 [Lophiotrema nucula]
MALHSVILAGLTLLYCIWISLKEVFASKRNGYEERKAIKGLQPSFQDSLKAMNDREQGRLQFEAMMTDMAGQQSYGMNEMFEPLPGVNEFSPNAVDQSAALTTGLSIDTFGNEWTMGVDTGYEYGGFDGTDFDVGNMQFPMD